MSEASLREDVSHLVGVIRDLAGGRYACLLDRTGILMEDPEPEEPEVRALRQRLEAAIEALFALPAAMAGEGPEEDVLAGWDHDDVFLAFLNGKVALVVACPSAEGAREALMKPLKALADRLLRWRETYRLDERGRGFFFGQPRLDIVTLGRH